MPDAMCLPHKNRNAQVRAVKLVHGVPMCADCFAGKPVETVASRFDSPSIHARDGQPADAAPSDHGYPQRSKTWRDCAGGCGAKVNPNNKTGVCLDCRKKETPMPNAVSENDRVAMQNARSDGQRIADIAKKFNVSEITVYKYTKGAKKKSPALMPASTYQVGEKLREPKPSKGGNVFAEAVAGLKHDREMVAAKLARIDTAIAAIEALNQ